MFTKNVSENNGWVRHSTAIRSRSQRRRSRSWNHLHQRQRYRERQHAYMIKLTSAENNIVAGTATPCSVPAFTTTGGIQVNGAVVPELAGGWGGARGAAQC